MEKEPQIERLIISFCDSSESIPASTVDAKFPPDLKIPLNIMQDEMMKWMLHLQMKYSTPKKGEVN